MKWWLIVIAVSLLGAGVICAGVVWNGTVYDNVGCDGDTPQGCLSDGGIIGSDGNVYFEGIMHWRAIGPASSGSHEAPSDEPFTSSRITVNKIIQQNVFQPAEPVQQKKAKQSGGMTGAKADFFYNAWEEGDLEGRTLGINAAASIGNKNEFTFTVPLHIVAPEEGDSAIGTGLDAAWKHQIGENWVVGAHANWIGYFGEDANGSSLACGPFGSFIFRPANRWIVSLGALFEITKPDEGDAFMELAPAGNVGFHCTDNLTVNLFCIYFRNLDSDVEDPDYFDTGADLRCTRGAWSLSAGLKTALGLNYVRSIEGFLGSEWNF